MISETQNPVLTWNFSQVFGDKAGHGEIAEADIISAVEFNHDGEYLATGDKGGRVVLFERNQTSVVSHCHHSLACRSPLMSMMLLCTVR